MRFLSSILLTVAALSCGGSEPTIPSNGGTPEPGPVIAPVKGFAKRSVTQGGIVFPYQVFAPENYVATQKWPIVVALAGTEERGSDNEKQVAVGLGPVVRAQSATFPAVVVFPQVPSDGTILNVFDQAVIQQIDDIVRDYNGDPGRIYLTGLSFGGTEGFSLLYNTPGKFAGFLAISPGMCPRCINATTLDQANSLVADKLKTLPIWMHWGDQDVSAAVVSNRQLVADFKADGATALKYNEYAGQGHAIWDMVYATPAVWTWLFAQRR
jgi:predicted peptidase